MACARGTYTDELSTCLQFVDSEFCFLIFACSRTAAVPALGTTLCHAGSTVIGLSIQDLHYRTHGPSILSQSTPPGSSSRYLVLGIIRPRSISRNQG